jgi:hypothetical protein
MPTIKDTHSSYTHILFGVSLPVVRTKQFNLGFWFDSSQVLIWVLSTLVTPGVLQPTPLKRISSRDSEQLSKNQKRGKLDFTS